MSENKLMAFVKRHWVFFCVMVLLLIATFIVPCKSVQVRYLSNHVRVDFSLYGYCVGVRPMNEASNDLARDLNIKMMLSGEENGIRRLVNMWNEDFGSDYAYGFKTRSYLYDTEARRDEYIAMVKAMGYKAEVIY